MNWKEIGLKEKQRERGQWLQKDLGVSEESNSFPVGRNGVMLVRLWPAE